MEHLPDSTLKAINKAIEETKDNTGLRLIFALNYGGRAEIVQSMKTIFDELSNEGLTSDSINEAMIEKHLMTHRYPDPELLIRTSGEQKLVIS